MHQSIATISSPEFINLQPLELNPLMSSCEIKVLYVGENRNHSFITKQVATEMSKTLRGAPIVGYFKTEKDDFADHGERVTFDDEGIHFECMTRPYGFVSPDAKVWFQKFEDYDDFGNSVEREYLMTTGYLWTGQFEEAAAAIQSGRPQSMELDEKTLKGNWTTNIKKGIDFFIINDAVFSKLCILGNDVEPCFEGASVTSPNVSKTFSLDDTFKQTLYSMIQDLKNFALKGGQSDMENIENSVVETSFTEKVEETNENQVKEVEIYTAENQNSTEESPVEELDTVIEYKKDEEEEEKKEESDSKSDEEDAPVANDSEEKEEEEDKKKKFELLESSYNELQEKYQALETQYQELVEFKKTIEDAKKDELINSFYMLSDEDKKDVIANKSNYSYDDIEAKLSVICVRKRVSFDNQEVSASTENPIVTFNLEDTESSVPAWVNALKNARKNN